MKGDESELPVWRRLVVGAQLLFWLCRPRDRRMVVRMGRTDVRLDEKG